MVGKKGTAKIHANSEYLNKADQLLNVLVEQAYIKAGTPKLLTIDQDATISNTCKSTGRMHMAKHWLQEAVPAKFNCPRYPDQRSLVDAVKKTSNSSQENGPNM
jgi:hypothetical protein